MNKKNVRNRQFHSKIGTTQLVKLYILHLLSHKTYYGKELINEISKCMDNKWEPSPGMIYPLLRELEYNNYVKGSWKEPDRRSIRHYRITDDGLTYYNNIKRVYRSTLLDSLEIIKNALNDIYNIKD